MMKLKPFTTEQLGYRLCYVSGEGPYLLWFTSSMERQSGDDWNDSPWWWCNAGEPYDHHGTELVSLCLVGAYSANCYEVSVDAINGAELAWLVSHGLYPAIQAGTTLGDFLSMATKHGLAVYLAADLQS